MKGRVCVLAVVALATVFFALPGFAEEVPAQAEMPKPPDLRWVHYDHVDPLKIDVFEARQKEFAEAFKAAKADPKWSYWVFQDGFEFVTSWAIEKFAELDEDGDAALAKVIGKETVDKLNAPTGSVAKHHSGVIKFEAGPSYEPPSYMDDMPGFLAHTTYWIRPGKEKEFLDLAKRVREAHVKTGQAGGYRVFRVELGEGTFVFTSLAKDAATYYARPGVMEVLTKAWSAEEAQKIYREYLGLVIDTEHRSYMVRGDLSYMPTILPAAAK